MLYTFFCMCRTAKEEWKEWKLFHSCEYDRIIFGVLFHEHYKEEANILKLKRFPQNYVR